MDPLRTQCLERPDIDTPTLLRRRCTAMAGELHQLGLGIARLLGLCISVWFGGRVNGMPVASFSPLAR